MQFIKEISNFKRTFAIFLLISAFLLLAFSTIRVLSAGNSHQSTSLKAFNDSILELEKKIDLSNLRNATVLNLIKEIKGSPGHSSISEPDGHPAFDRIEQLQGYGDGTSLVALQDGNSCPSGIDPVSIMAGELDEILKDERINPGAKELNRIQRAQAAVEATKAQAIIKVNDSKVLLEAAKAIEELKPTGEFIEYRQGEAYQTVSGVMTAAELVAGGITRMFYLFPEKFGKLYDLRQEKAEVCKSCLSNIIKIIDTQEK
jgi:hypothetical protein